MAFMMPVVKKDYTLYSAPNKTIPGAGGKQRRTNSETDGGGGSRRSSNNSNSNNNQNHHPIIKRRIKSEGPTTLSTSSPIKIISGSANNVIRKNSQPIAMRRVRGSAPNFAHSLPLHENVIKGPSTAPTGNSPTHCQVNSPSRSTSSSSESSESTAFGRFHNKLIARLRKSLKIKNSEPSST